MLLTGECVLYAATLLLTLLFALWSTRLMLAVRTVFGHCAELEGRPEVWARHLGAAGERHTPSAKHASPPPPNAVFEMSFLFQQLVLCLYATRLMLHRRAFQLFFWLLVVPQLALIALTLLLFLGSGGAYPSALAILAQPLHFALVLACAAPRMYCSLYV